MLHFAIYGLLGWCMEILWTGFASLRRRKRKLMGYTSLWMFPIYGCASLLEPLYKAFSAQLIFVRGAIYMLCILAFEFVTGWFLRDVLKSCPWDYSGKKDSLYGLIRLSYAPAWFAAGILFENVYTGLNRLGI